MEKKIQVNILPTARQRAEEPRVALMLGSS